MQIRRMNPALIRDERLDVAVVIDVLRATSTAVVLTARVDQIYVIATPAEIKDLDSLGPGKNFVFFSELELGETAGHQLDNSPIIAREVDLTGRTPVLVTTNGTKAIRAACNSARLVIVAGFLNIGAVAEYLIELGPDEVTILPAGDFAGAKPHLEDEQCGLALEKMLQGEPCRPIDCARECDSIARKRKGLPESNSGFTGDLSLCLVPDLYSVVPVVSKLDAASSSPLVISPVPRLRSFGPRSHFQTRRSHTVNQRT